MKTTVRLRAPFATLRKPFARSYGETSEEVTPRAAKQVLLSLIGEYDRGAYPDSSVSVQHLTKSRVALTIRKIDQRKYGVQGKKPRPDYVEVLCEVDCLVSVDGGSRRSRPRGTPPARGHGARGLSQPGTERRPVRGVAGVVSRGP